MSPALLRVAGLRGALGAGHGWPAPASTAQAARSPAAATGPTRSDRLRRRVRGTGVPGGGRRGGQPRPQARTTGRASRVGGQPAPGEPRLGSFPSSPSPNLVRRLELRPPPPGDSEDFQQRRPLFLCCPRAGLPWCGWAADGS